jgi:hypothetical protein
MFFSEDGLNPTAFPSLRKFESEVVAMTASLLNGDKHVCGNMTNGDKDQSQGNDNNLCNTRLTPVCRLFYILYNPLASQDLTLRLR